MNTSDAETRISSRAWNRTVRQLLPQHSLPEGWKKSPMMSLLCQLLDDITEQSRPQKPWPDRLGSDADVSIILSNVPMPVLTDIHNILRRRCHALFDPKPWRPLP
jgi:hypothetical protein